VRRETSHYGGDPCSFVALGPNERVRLIAEMLGNPPKEIPWQTRVVANIEFQSMEQFKIDLLAFVEEQQQMYRATAEELESRGLLEKWEAQQSLPLLRLSLSDIREKGAEPISKDSIHLPDRVEWAPSPTEAGPSLTAKSWRYRQCGFQFSANAVIRQVSQSNPAG
jgi:hypothetical protein